MAALPLRPRKRDASPSWITGPRVVALVAGWLAIAWLAAPSLGLYYEGRAGFYLVPPLILIYGYCLSRRRRFTALLAIVATVIVVLVIGFVAAIPKATSAFAP